MVAGTGEKGTVDHRAPDSALPLRGTQGVPRKGGLNVGRHEGSNMKNREQNNQTSCYLRPPFLGTPLAAFEMYSALSDLHGALFKCAFESKP